MFTSMTDNRTCSVCVILCVSIYVWIVCVVALPYIFEATVLLACTTVLGLWGCHTICIAAFSYSFETIVVWLFIIMEVSEGKSVLYYVLFWDYRVVRFLIEHLI